MTPIRRDVDCLPVALESGAIYDAQFWRKAVQRLGLASGAFGVALMVLVWISLLVYGPLGWEAPSHLPHFLTVQSVLAVVSFGLAAVCRTEALPPRRIARLGVVYQVLGALLISICAFQGDMLLQPVMVKLSWLAVWILIFPLLVPGPPLRGLTVSLLCATTAPVVFFSWSWLDGRPLPAAPILLDTFLPYYVCAGLAVVPAYLMHDLGSSASAARRLGSYRLVERIGRGGMGEVWRAEHRFLVRPAAVKLIRPQDEGSPFEEEALLRFAYEAQATAGLTSPHTVRIYDYGVTPEGTLYYAMELLEGLDLEELVERFGPVSPARAVHLLRQACDSLGEAHRAGVVHRDIKPSNLLACHVGGKLDFVKVVDFGLARRLRAPDAEPAGTAAVVAPEQISAPDQVDGRADLYALGGVAYWLLTGRLVFERETESAMLADQLQSPPPAPSGKSERALPPELEQLVLECLAKDPAQRPQTAEELYRRLGRLDVGSWTQQQAQLWWQARLGDRLPDPPAAGDDDQEPDLPSQPLVAVGAISAARIRARQEAYRKREDGAEASPR